MFSLRRVPLPVPHYVISHKQENIDAKHQYAEKLICHALLSSL